MGDLEHGTDHPWMRLARKMHGVREVRGGEDETIMSFHAVVDPGRSYLDEDEDPWCASFASWALHVAGMDSPRTARARGFLEYGEDLAEPRYGCIAVLWRGSPDAATGHVGFVLDAIGDQVVLLGGNQNNRVQMSVYPRSQVLSWRWPVRG